VRDTPPEVEARQRALLMQRSGAERVEMGFGMLQCAREIAAAGLRAQGVDDLRVGLFLRFYGHEFSPEERERIVDRLREYGEREAGERCE